MRTITQNYWGKNTAHIIPRWLDNDIKVISPKPIQMKLKRELHDTDSDGVPNFADCNPWNPNEQGWLHDQGAKVYDRLREAKLLRKRRVLAENKKDRDLTVYVPSGSEEDISVDKAKERRKKIQERRDKIGDFGKKISDKYKNIKSSKSVKFAKGVYDEAKQFNPESRKEHTFKSVVGAYRIYVLENIVDASGKLVAQEWSDMNNNFDRDTAEQVAYQLTQSGHVYKIIPPKTTRTDEWKAAAKEGLHIKREQHTPVAQVMVHAGRGMSGQQVQQQAGYSSRSTAGYSPPFVGATKKQFRVGGDR